MSEEQINQTPGEWDQQNQGGGSWGGTEPPQQGQPPWMGPNPTQPYPEGNMVPGGGQQGGGQSIEGNGDPGDGSSYRPGGVNYPGNQRGQRAPEGNMTPGGGGFNPFGQQQSQGGGSYYDPPWNAGSGQYNDPRTQEELMGRSQEQALAESGQGGGGMGGGGWSQRIPWKNGGTVNGKPGFDSRGYVPGKGLWMS